MEIIKHAVLTNIYWFSLPLIGYAVLLFLKNNQLSSYLGSLSQIALKQHFFVGFVISFTITFFIISLLSLPLYIFHMPAVVAAVTYTVMLGLSSLYLFLFLAKRLFDNSDIDPLFFKKQTLLVKLLLVTVCLIVLADFVVGVFIAQAYPWGDGAYHMARVMNMVSDGFNVQTSYFNNIPESGYMYNAFYTLFIIPSALFHLDAMKVWEYSLGFFRVLLWFSIFALAVSVFRDWLKAKNTWLLFSYLSVLSAIAINAAGFFVANYPSRLAYVWFILLAILLSFSSSKAMRAARPLIVAVCFLLSMTHIIYAVIAACFLVLITIVKFLVVGRSYLSRSTLTTTGLSIVILLSTPVISKFLPVRASDDLINLMGSPAMNVFGGMKILIPHLPAAPIDWFVYIIGILGVLGVLNILRVSKSKHEVSVLLSLTIFYLLVAHVPFVFTVMCHILPMWVIERFDSMNVAQYINFVLAMYVILHYAKYLKQKYGRPHISEQRLYQVLVIFVLILTVATAGSIASQTYGKLVEDRKDKVAEYQLEDRTARAFRGIFKGNKVIVTTPTYSYRFASLFNVDILAVEYGHSPIASDGANRSLCQDYILKNISYNELYAVGADYIIQFPSDKTSMAGTKPYLKLVAQSQEFNVYEVQKDYKSDAAKVYQPCLDFRRIEKS